MICFPFVVVLPCAKEHLAVPPEVLYPVDPLGSNLDNCELCRVMGVDLINSPLLELFATLFGVAPYADKGC